MGRTLDEDVVLKEIGRWIGYLDEDMIERIKIGIKKLPERKTGKWIQNDNGTYSCSLCQSWIPEEQRHYARYCLYCGSEMERRTDEQID